MALGTETISTIMSTNVHCVKVDQKIKDAIEVMMAHDIRHLVVKNDQNELAGIISKNDVDKIRPRHNKPNDVNEKLMESLNIEHMMTKNVRTVEPNDTIKYAVELISHCSYNALPVVDDDKLVGIITTTDLLTYLLRHC
ncbi:MAG: CBS domain-containing protein [Chitinophagales bacterium]|nr:CBS domain-containing protein [Chitinophagales bacterium]